LIPAVVAKAEESKDLPTRKDLEVLLRLEENKDVEQQKVQRPMPVLWIIPNHQLQHCP